MRTKDPEAMYFLDAETSPSGTPLLIVSGSVSSSVTVFEVELISSPSMEDLSVKNASDPDTVVVPEVSSVACAAMPTMSPVEAPTSSPTASGATREVISLFAPLALMVVMLFL